MPIAEFKVSFIMDAVNVVEMERASKVCVDKYSQIKVEVKGLWNDEKIKPTKPRQRRLPIVLAVITMSAKFLLLQVRINLL